MSNQQPPNLAGLPPQERALQYAHIEVDVKRVREVGGNNRGPDVEKYLKCVGLGWGFPWCRAFVQWCIIQAGIPKDILGNHPASVCSTMEAVKPYVTADFGSVTRGDLLCWCDRGVWAGHIGFIVGFAKDAQGNPRHGYIETLEGNTGPDGGRDGDGAYRKIRRVTPNMRRIRFADLLRDKGVK